VQAADDGLALAAVVTQQGNVLCRETIRLRTATAVVSLAPAYVFNVGQRLVQRPCLHHERHGTGQSRNSTHSNGRPSRLSWHGTYCVAGVTIVCVIRFEWGENSRIS